MVPQSNMVLGLDLASQQGPLCVEFAGTENTCMGLQYSTVRTQFPSTVQRHAWLDE